MEISRWENKQLFSNSKFWWSDIYLTSFYNIYHTIIQSRSSELFGIRIRLPVSLSRSLAGYEILASENGLGSMKSGGTKSYLAVAQKVMINRIPTDLHRE